MLLLMRQRWRASINRFAEAMTLFAAAIAGLFPIMHLGRPMYFYWLTPYPNTMARVAAVAQRADLGFLGDPELHPVLDHLLVCRPHSRSRHVARPRQDDHGARLIYGAFALGWRGSARHWHHLRVYHITMAASPCRWWCRCTASSVSTSRRA